MNWKIPYFADSTAALVKHQWLLRTMGPNYTRDQEETRLDRASENYPEYMTKNDQADRRTR